MGKWRTIVLATGIAAAGFIFETLIGHRAVAQTIVIDDQEVQLAGMEDGLLEGDCDGKTSIIAVTNMVPTMIRNPRNVGDCDIKLGCFDASNPPKQVGRGALISAAALGGQTHFNCGANAQTIRAMCALVPNKKCQLRFVP